MSDHHNDSFAQSGLPRTLEPEAMDDAEEVREYGEMDHSTVNERFVVDLISGGQVGPRVIDMGCGLAAISVLLCQRVDDVEVLGIDSSVEMLEAARIEIELGGVQGRVFLEHADCKSLADFPSGEVATIISNSLVHHVAAPECVIREAVRLLAPGGRMFLRDLARPTSSEQVESLVSAHAGEESEFAQQLLRQSLHAALTVEEMSQVLADCGVGQDSIAMTSDRHWTIDWIKA